MTDDSRCESCGVPSVSDYWRHRDVVCSATVHLRRHQYDGPMDDRLREITSTTAEYGPSIDDTYTLLSEVSRLRNLLARTLEILEEIE